MLKPKDKPKILYARECVGCHKQFSTYSETERYCIKCEWERPVDLTSNLCARCHHPTATFYCGSCK